MKIAEIKVGEEYGALPHNAGYRALPRQVEVIEIDVKEKRFYNSDKTRKIRRPKIKFLDPARVAPRRYGDPFESFTEGAVTIVDPKQLVGPWSALRDEVKAKIEERRTRQEAAEALEARVKRIMGRREGWSTSSWGGKPEVEFRGEKAIDYILGLAEAGLIATA